MEQQKQAVEAAFKKLGLDVHSLEIPARYTAAMSAIFKALVVSEALRDGFEPDYNNPDQLQYDAQFDVETWSRNPEGFRFVTAAATATDEVHILSRLTCQETEETAKELGEILEYLFSNIYKNK